MKQTKLIFHDEDVKMKAFLPGVKVRFVHSAHMTLAEWRFSAGAVLPEHNHANEQITKIINGQFELTVDNELIRLKEGTSVIITPGAIHSGRAVTDCHIIDVFHPVREDYR